MAKMYISVLGYSSPPLPRSCNDFHDCHDQYPRAVLPSPSSPIPSSTPSPLPLLVITAVLIFVCVLLARFARRWKSSLRLLNYRWLRGKGKGARRRLGLNGVELLPISTKSIPTPSLSHGVGVFAEPYNVSQSNSKSLLSRSSSLDVMPALSIPPQSLLIDVHSSPSSNPFKFSLFSRKRPNSRSESHRRSKSLGVPCRHLAVPSSPLAGSSAPPTPSPQALLIDFSPSGGSTSSDDSRPSDISRTASSQASNGTSSDLGTHRFSPGASVGLGPLIPLPIPSISGARDSPRGMRSVYDWEVEAYAVSRPADPMNAAFQRAQPDYAFKHAWADDVDPLIVYDALTAPPPSPPPSSAVLLSFSPYLHTPIIAGHPRTLPPGLSSPTSEGRSLPSPHTPGVAIPRTFCIPSDTELTLIAPPSSSSLSAQTQVQLLSISPSSSPQNRPYLQSASSSPSQDDMKLVDIDDGVPVLRGEQQQPEAVDSKLPCVTFYHKDLLVDFKHEADNQNDRIEAIDRATCYSAESSMKDVDADAENGVHSPPPPLPNRSPSPHYAYLQRQSVKPVHLYASTSLLPSSLPYVASNSHTQGSTVNPREGADTWTRDYVRRRGLPDSEAAVGGGYEETDDGDYEESNLIHFDTDRSVADQEETMTTGAGETWSVEEVTVVWSDKHEEACSGHGIGLGKIVDASPSLLVATVEEKDTQGVRVDADSRLPASTETERIDTAPTFFVEETDSFPADCLLDSGALLQAPLPIEAKTTAHAHGGINYDVNINDSDDNYDDRDAIYEHHTCISLDTTPITFEPLSIPCSSYQGTREESFTDPDLLPLPLSLMIARTPSSLDLFQTEQRATQESLLQSSSQIPTPYASPPSSSLHILHALPSPPSVTSDVLFDQVKSKDQVIRPAWSIRASDAPALGLSVTPPLHTPCTCPSPDLLALGTAPDNGSLTQGTHPAEGGNENVGTKDACTASEELQKTLVHASPMKGSTSLPCSFPSPGQNVDTLLSPLPPSPPPTFFVSSAHLATATNQGASASAIGTAVTDIASQLIEPRRRTVRSPLDLALAMQLRPGLGLGADPAWMVRFLMSMFGWFAVLLSGQGELEGYHAVQR